MKAQIQREKILDWLIIAPMTTLDARNELFIMSPASRVLELKHQGYKIITRMVKAGSRKIAQYILLVKEESL